ncbi:MAG: transporter [Nitrosomonadales bacterium]|nr:transporter [Nitrosomonadales bacterium]
MRFNKTTLACSIAAALAAISGTAAASGFALIEQSASGLGNAYAGGAASAEDASTIFFNPAGMSRLQGKQIAVAAHIITPSAKFSDTASTIPTGPGFIAAPIGKNAGSTAIVPSAYFSWAIDPQLSAGVGLGAPFGLKTEYDANWMGRFHAIKSEIKTVNINPSVAYKINETVSLGVGVNWQKFDAELTKAINYKYIAVLAGAGGLVADGTEGSHNITASDSAWGYNFGAIFAINPIMTVGIAYRSAMSYNLSGSVAYANRPAIMDTIIAGGGVAGTALSQQVGDGSITADIKLPATTSIALKYQPNSRWDILIDATQTQWSSIQSLDINRSSGLAAGLPLESVPFQWRNTWRVAVGANHHYNEQWMARIGLAYDQTPTSDTYRIARLPDSDRTWLSLGGQYKPNKESAIDFSYAHLFMKDAALNMNVPVLSAAQAAGRGALIGNYSNKVDILSIQYTHSF